MQQRLNAALTKLEARFQALSLRERVLVSVMVLAVVAGLAEFSIFGPLRDQRAFEKRAQADLQQRTEQLENELAQLQAWHSHQNAGAELAGVEQKLAIIDGQIQQLSQRMVPPEQMTALLQQLLQRDHGMQVLSLEKLPLETAEPAADKTAAAETVMPRNKGSNDGLYRHRLRVSLRGNYFDTLAYLQAMEALPWTVYWDRLDYQTDVWPNGVLTLEIATIGQEEGWLGG